MTDHLGNKLFLLMVELSRIRDRGRIIATFTEALSGLLENLSFEFHENFPESACECMEVATPESLLGWIAVEGPFRDISPELQSLVRNAAQMLAQVLESRLRAEALSRERDSLERIVARRTADLSAANEELRREIEHRKKAETALRESEERCRELVNQASEGILVVQENVVQFANRALEEMVEAYSDQLVGKPIADFIHPDDRHMVMDRYRRRINGENAPSIYYFRILARQGRIKWVELRGARILWLGRPATLSLLTDITQRKEAELSARRLAAIVESSEDAIIGKTPDGTVFSWNQAAERIYGYTADEIVGRSIFVLAPFEPPDEIHEILSRIRAGESVVSRETVRRRKDGSLLDVSISVSPIKDEEDRVIGASTIARDITAQKQVERELQESRREYQDLYDNAPDMFATVDRATGKIVKCNGTLLKALGYSREEVIGRTVFDLYHEDSIEKARAAFDAFLGDGEISNAELVLRHKDGSGVDVTLNASAVRDEKGNVRHARLSWRNITELKEARREKARLEVQLRRTQKMEAVGTLAGGIAHDFNNILSAIMGYAELAQMDAVELPAVKQRLGAILKASDRARALVDQILTFSRHKEQERRPTQLEPIVKEALKFLRASLPTTIEIQQRLDSQGAMVLADPTRIHQVLMNLCTNAAQAMKGTGGVLEISLQKAVFDKEDPTGLLADLGGPCLKLSVADTGTGIDEERMERIFEPYFTTKEADEGTGLGLAIVHGIVQSHGGAVEVDSTEGEGSAFHVYLPVHEGGETEPVSPGEIGVPGGSERILFVDDETALADIARQILEYLGYEVTCCTSSPEALEVLHKQAEPFDLLITDQTMPEMTGAQLARLAKRIHPEMPVVLCTGYSAGAVLNNMDENGIDGLLLKPLTLNRMGEVIRSVLDGK